MAKPKLDIVIPVAGMGRRMKSFGPKGLIQVGPETVIGRQIRLLTAAYPHSRVIVVAGFEAEKVRRAVPAGTKVIVNRDYEDTNVAHSLCLGLSASRPGRHALVVYGDLVFNRRAVEGIPTDGTSAVLVDDGAGRMGEVGVNVVAGRAVHFSYGLDTTWAHIVMLAPHEKRLFLAACREYDLRRHFGYEVLNHVIDAGGTFDALVRPELQLVEIDASKDIEKAARVGC